MLDECAPLYAGLSEMPLVAEMQSYIDLRNDGMCGCAIGSRIGQLESNVSGPLAVSQSPGIAGRGAIVRRFRGTGDGHIAAYIHTSRTAGNNAARAE